MNPDGETKYPCLLSRDGRLYLAAFVYQALFSFDKFAYQCHIY